MSSALEQGYDPAELEPRLYARWEASGIFHADVEDEGEPFVIVIPPPNVTGSLHIGHALDNTLQDVRDPPRADAGPQRRLAARHRPRRHRRTQMVVERELAAEGLSRQDLGREAFVERVWEYKAEYGGMILRQLRRLGCSCDWDRESFTLDEPRNRAVRDVFVDCTSTA